MRSNFLSLVEIRSSNPFTRCRHIHGHVTKVKHRWPHLIQCNSLDGSTSEFHCGVSRLSYFGQWFPGNSFSPVRNLEKIQNSKLQIQMGKAWKVAIFKNCSMYLYFWKDTTTTWSRAQFMFIVLNEVKWSLLQFITVRQLEKSSYTQPPR